MEPPENLVPAPSASKRPVKFVASDEDGLPLKRRQVQQACDSCRRKKVGATLLYSPYIQTCILCVRYTHASKTTGLADGPLPLAPPPPPPGDAYARFHMGDVTDAALETLPPRNRVCWLSVHPGRSAVEAVGSMASALANIAAITAITVVATNQQTTSAAAAAAAPATAAAAAAPSSAKHFTPQPSPSSREAATLTTVFRAERGRHLDPAGGVSSRRAVCLAVRG